MLVGSFMIDFICKHCQRFAIYLSNHNDHPFRVLRRELGLDLCWRVMMMVVKATTVWTVNTGLMMPRTSLTMNIWRKRRLTLKIETKS